MGTLKLQTFGIGRQRPILFFTRQRTDTLFGTVSFLGEKAPIEDIFLEINDPTTPYSCLVQIKSTEKGYNTKGNLKVKVPKKKFQALVDRPLPTYVAGVDLNKEIVFISPAFNSKDRHSSMSIRNKLDFTDPVVTKTTLNELKSDIINYWNNATVFSVKSSYISKL